MKKQNQIEQPRSSIATQKGLFTFYKEEQERNQLLKAQEKLKKKVKNLSSNQKSARSHNEETSLSKRSKNSKQSSKKSFQSRKKSKKKIKSRNITEVNQKKTIDMRRVSLAEDEDFEEVDLKQRFLKNILNRKLQRSQFSSTKLENENRILKKESFHQEQIPEEIDADHFQDDFSHSCKLKPRVSTEHYLNEKEISSHQSSNKLIFFSKDPHTIEQLPPNNAKVQKNKNNRIDTEPASIHLLRKRFEEIDYDRNLKKNQSPFNQKEMPLAVKKEGKRHHFKKISSFKNQRFNDELLDEFIKVKSRFYEREKKQKFKKRYGDQSSESHDLPISPPTKNSRKQSPSHLPSKSLKFPQIKQTRLSKALKNIMEIAYKESIPVHKYGTSKSKKILLKKSLEKSQKKLDSNLFCENYNMSQINDYGIKNESSLCPENESKSVCIPNRCQSRVSMKMAKIDLSRVDDSPKYQQWSLQKKKALKKLGLKIQEQKPKNRQK